MKFKELRMFFINSTLLVLMLIGMIFFFMNGEIARALIGSFIVLLMVMMVFGKYTLKVFDDSMLGYEFKGIGIMPVLIEFKDIKEMQLISKHKIQVEHLHKTRLYIVDAEAFYNEVQQKIETQKKDGK